MCKFGTVLLKLAIDRPHLKQIERLNVSLL